MKKRDYVGEYYEAINALLDAEFGSSEFENARANISSIMKDGVEAHDIEMAEKVMEDIENMLEDDFDATVDDEEIHSEIELLESNGFWYLVSESQEKYDFGPTSVGARLKQYKAKKG